MDVLIFILWIFISFFIASFIAILGKKYGVEYPIAIVAALVVMANIFANKIVLIGPFEVPAGILVFSMIFFITDLISEKWGKKYAYKAVWAGFFANLILIVSLYMVLNWQAPVYAKEISDMFIKVFNLTPRIILASLIAYILSQNHDVWSFDFWKKKTRGRHLWLRNNASTMVSQLIDSVVFVMIAFYGVFPVWQLIIGLFSIKVLIALLDTPFLYFSRWIMRKV